MASPTTTLFDTITTPLPFAAFFLCLTLIAVLRRKLATRCSTLPPGPPPESWIFGNKVPTDFSYRKYEEWTKQYGPIFSLRQGFTTVIVIGRYEAAIEIMERRSSALVDRPVAIAAGETLSGGMRVVLTPAGERFKKMRVALRAYLSPKAVRNYRNVFMNSAREHLLDLLDTPDLHQEHAKRYSTSVVMALAYAKKPGKYDDPDVIAVHRCLVRLGVTLRPGLWKVDTYPILRYLPGYLNELKSGHQEELGVFMKHLTAVKEQMKSGLPMPESFAHYLLSRQSALGLSDDETAYLAGALFGAGSDTSASAVSVTLLAAACYPEAARRVQEELDAVIGRERLPTPADYEKVESMPQLRAFVLETFRWRPVTAGGFAHKATEPIIYKNFVIPAGASVIGNIWSVGRDPQYFSDPERFDPQRWINQEDGTLKRELRSYPFGFGRRVCPGQYIATTSVLLNTALIQWAFTVHMDAKHPIDELAFTESANAHPAPFKVLFEPRIQGGEEALRAILAEYGVAET